MFSCLKKGICDVKQAKQWSVQERRDKYFLKDMPDARAGEPHQQAPVKSVKDAEGLVPYFRRASKGFANLLGRECTAFQ